MPPGKLPSIRSVTIQVSGPRASAASSERVNVNALADSVSQVAIWSWPSNRRPSSTTAAPMAKVASAVGVVAPVVGLLVALDDLRKCHRRDPS